MAVIYSYPVKSTPELTDKMLISDGTDNLTKQVTISGVKDTIDVVDSLAATLPIEVSASSGAVTVSSRAYAGAATTGYVPTGGSNTTFLRGDGTWVTPTGGGGSYQAGDGIDIDTNTNPDTLKTGLTVNGGLVFNTGKMQVDLAATAMAGELRVVDGGTGLTTAAAGTITRGNGTSAFIADTYLQYEGTQKSLKIRGTGNTAPSLSCTLSINDAQGPSGKAACIGLTPTGAQGAKAMHLDLGAYNTGIQVNRNNSLASNAMIFQQTVSGSTQVGSIAMTNSATAFNTSSDYRLKENVVDMTGAVDRVKQLKPSRFNFISEPDDKIVDGFLAHEVSNIVPEAITGSKDEVDADGNAVYQGIDQSKLVPLLVGAIKELTARIEALEA